MKMIKSLVFAMLGLFTSFGTLMCCALPALFVSLGAGAVLAGVIGQFPQLVWFSENKNFLFILSGSLITIAGLLVYNARNAPCPSDVKQARACIVLRQLNVWIYVLSLLIWSTGLFFAYFAVHFI